MSEEKYIPKSKLGKWFDSRLPLLSLSHHVRQYPTPKNLNYWWTFGGILTFCLIIQIITGVILGMHYVAHTDHAFESYEPTKAGRLIQAFVVDQLSNWYVRLSRRRFWKGEYNFEKIAAYQTLYECLETISVLAAPIAPFFMDNLFKDLNNISNIHAVSSVHLADFPKFDSLVINTDLEKKMGLAQSVTSLALSLRKKERLRVRQPLQKIMIPILDEKMKTDIEGVSAIIKSEINVKEIEFLGEDSTVLTKQIKPNFKTLGPKFEKDMKLIAAKIAQFSADNISEIEKNNRTK